ncbi:kinase-like domain-containing protein, partial [Glomus cerebriforme]
YKTGITLSAGAYAVIKSGKYFAMKIISKNLLKGREHMVKNEINNLKKVSQGHKNILKLVDYFETVNNCYLVTEYTYGGELFDRIVSKGSYPEYDVVNLVRNITDAVAYLHDNGISENILFRTHDENYDIIIIGFHFSRIIDDSEVLTTIHGSTPYYVAPEIFKKSGYGKPVDLWAIGVITYFLLCGYTPFYRENSKEELTAIIQSERSFDIKFWDGISDLAKDFINQLLIADPNERITAHQALAHPWFSAVFGK